MIGTDWFPLRHVYRDSSNAPSITQKGTAIRKLVNDRKRTPYVLRAVKGYKRKRKRH